MRTVKTLIRLGKCPGWSESSLSAQPHYWFCHVVAHIIMNCDIKRFTCISSWSLPFHLYFKQAFHVCLYVHEKLPFHMVYSNFISDFLLHIKQFRRKLCILQKSKHYLKNETLFSIVVTASYLQSYLYYGHCHGRTYLQSCATRGDFTCPA